jgi:hypothetical protein
MENVNHTPAPWHICETTGRGLKLIRDANGYCVAEAVNPAVQAAQYINADANARLIAAAPDLLAALDEIFNGVGMTGPTMDAARAAIAKAKGQL